MNVNFGLLPPLAERARGKEKKELMSRRALADMAAWLRETETRIAPADTQPNRSVEIVSAR
jgi:methylenetetrahydrofolate--tRNA-(uracil-5-)-methyltransferase